MTNAASTEVEFHGQRIPMIDHGGVPYVAMRPIVEAIGLAWPPQYRRIKTHPVMGASVITTVTEAEGVGRREAVALPLEHLNGWLFGVDSRRVKPELRERLITYQRECFAVLYRHWHGEAAPGPEQGDADLPPSVHHRADHIVSATRAFNGLLRAGQSMRLPRPQAVMAANAAARDATGYDICAALGVTQEDVPDAGVARITAAPGTDGDDWLGKVAAWLQGRSRATSWEALQAVDKAADQATPADLAHVAACMRRCGWRKQREWQPGRAGQRWVWFAAEETA